MSEFPAEWTLRTLPDEALRQKCQPVETIDEALRSLTTRMIEVMREEEGIGLAAPQVGVGLRVFVCDVPGEPGDTDEEPGPAAATDGVLVCINPEITDPSDERTPFEEGCLSIPHLRGDVIRPERVRLTATGLDGERFTLPTAGLLARCVQHEADHLDGVLIIDKLTQMARLKNRRRLRELGVRA
ncbi:MAG: peptide deformylase [Phycisphaerales bacterium]